MDDIVQLFFKISPIISAIGTLVAAAFAVYFGFFGNRQTEMLTKRITSELDVEFFEFLTSIPSKITSHIDDRIEYGTGDETSGEYISFYSKKILDKAFIGNGELKKYRNYINLATRYAELGGVINNPENREKIFNQIKEEAEKLSTKVDRNTKLKGMRKLLKYECSFWKQNIFLVSTIERDENHPDYLVYSTLYTESDDKSCQKASEIVQEHFNNEFSIKDNDYIDNNKYTCEIIYPSHYELINRTDKVIEIRLNGEQIKLDYQKPRKLSWKWSDVI